MKLHLYIADAVDFCKGGDRLSCAFAVRGGVGELEDPYYAKPDDWVFVQTIEIDESLIDTDAVRNTGLAFIDAKEEELRAQFASRLADIERHRGEMLALPA